MIEILFILSIINILIFFNFKKISKFINLYDIPNKNLKTHKKKPHYRWIYFNVKYNFDIFIDFF